MKLSINSFGGKFIVFILLLIIFKMNVFSAMWTFELDKRGRHQSTIELDPYYSYIDYVMSLTDAPIPKIYLEKESSIYLHMFRNIYKPRYILFETSAYPLPILGAIYKREYPDQYEDFNITKTFNVVKTVTDGFPEPAAFSVFIGNVMDFVVGDEMEVVGKGYGGWLASIGNYHIVNNSFVKDNWIEWEIKVKGEDVRKEHSISWSYGAGGKNHANSEIRDTLYFKIKRNHIIFNRSYEKFYYFFIRNITQEVRIDVDRTDALSGEFHPTRYFFLVGKNIPFANNKATFSFSIGALKTLANGYSGSLDEKIDNSWSFILRPNLSFFF